MSEFVPVSEPRSETTRKGHEPDRVPALIVVALAVAVVIMVVLVELGVSGFIRLVGRPFAPPLALSGDAQRRLEGADHWSVQPEDLEALRRTENRNLTTYGWIDKEAGVVRIPLDRAMQLDAAEQAAKRGEGTP